MGNDFATGDDRATEVETFDFGDALRLLTGGFRLARKGWNGKGMWIALQVPDNHSKMTLPYIYMSTAVGYDVRRQCDIKGDLVPWLASQSDILAQDWVLVPE